MVTLKLKKPAAHGQPDESPARAPLRGRGARPRPTLSQAQERRDDHARTRHASTEEPRSRPPARRDEWSPSPARRDDRPPSARRDEGPRWPNDHRPAPTRQSFRPEPLRPQRTQDARAASPAASREGRAAQRPAQDSRTPNAHRPRDEAGQRPAQGDASPPIGLRLSKRMSELGLASRREADEWIEQGWVRVDGKVVSALGSRVLPHQQITVSPEATQQQAQRVTVILNKPVGYVSGQAEDGYEPAVVLVTSANHWGNDRSGLRFSPAHLRHLAPAGRLDIDSVGLLVLTQDGRIAKHLIGERSDVEKEYLVRVTWANAERHPPGALMHTFPADQLERLRHGLEIDGEPLKPAKVSWQNEDQLRFVLREGKKRQIRRMCEAVGLAVTGLKRVRIGRISLGDLPPGQWRYLGPFERF